MRSLVFLASVLWVGSAFGGTLIPPRFDRPDQDHGAMAFSGSSVYLQSISPTEGATIAWVDIHGFAERMDLLSKPLVDGRVSGRYEVVASAQPEDIGNGFTRFSFRGLGLKTEMRPLEDRWVLGFGQGASGITVGLSNGTLSAVRKNEAPFIVNSYILDSGTQEVSEIPLGWGWMGVTLETLDPPFGDATGDGRIDINDFGTLKDGFGQPTTPYQNGDVTGNLTVDMTDFGILKQNFGWKQEAAVVPEPSAFALLLLGIGAFFLRLFTK
jgi:hypothetical protein